MRLLIVILAVAGASGDAVAAPAVVAYAHPAACVASTVRVHQRRDEDDAGYRAEVTFTFRGASETSSVPTEVGNRLAANTTYTLCATLIDTKPGAKPIVSLIEVRRGARIVWTASYEFPVTQTIARTRDGKALLVELGRAMDDVWATPFPRGMAPIAIAAPADALRAAGDGTRTIALRITERADGARVELAAIFDGTSELWRAP